MGPHRHGTALSHRLTFLGFAFTIVVFCLLTHSTSAVHGAKLPKPQTLHRKHVNIDLLNADINQLQKLLSTGKLTSVELVKMYLERIDKVNKKGPALNAIIETNPDAIAIARRLDIERKMKGPRGPLHGIPILVKDNIATFDKMNTTAGSFALLGSKVPRDAHVIAKLRRAGAIILGKTNLSEWANFRSSNNTNGWSARGGQTKSAYVLNGDPCGSSSGSGVATSIGLAAVSLGTETDGSIICPSSSASLVGIKPTVGLTSRAGVIPISHTQDSVGPMARNTLDAAIVLSIIAGPDPRDPATLARGAKFHPDYTKLLNKKYGFKGYRIGVPRKVFFDPDYIGSEVAVAIEKAIKIIAKAGAHIQDPANLPSASEIVTSNNETVVLEFDFKQDINKYINGLVSSPVKNLADIIQFNIKHASEELPPEECCQDLFISSQNTTNLNDPVYKTALAADYNIGRTRGIDYVLRKYKLDALVLPAVGYSTAPAAIAGYPMITVPLGYFSTGAPFGLAFIGTAWSEPTLLHLAYVFEQLTHVRQKVVPRFAP